MTRLRTTRTTSSLPARRTARPPLHEPLHARVRIVLGLLDTSRVHDVHHVRDSHRRLGHVRSYDDLAACGRQEHHFLLGAGQVRVQWQDLDGSEICRLQFGDALADFHHSRHEDQDGSLVGRRCDMLESSSDKAVVDAVGGC